MPPAHPPAHFLYGPPLGNSVDEPGVGAGHHSCQQRKLTSFPGALSFPCAGLDCQSWSGLAAGKPRFLPFGEEALPACRLLLWRRLLLLRAELP